MINEMVHFPWQTLPLLQGARDPSSGPNKFKCLVRRPPEAPGPGGIRSLSYPDSIHGALLK